MDRLILELASVHGTSDLKVLPFSVQSFCNSFHFILILLSFIYFFHCHLISPHFSFFHLTSLLSFHFISFHFMWFHVSHVGLPPWSWLGKTLQLQCIMWMTTLSVQLQSESTASDLERVECAWVGAKRPCTTWIRLSWCSCCRMVP